MNEDKNVEVKVEVEKVEPKVEPKAKNILNDVADTSGEYDKKEIDSGKVMALLSYIIPPVPYFVEKNNKFVQYHAKQGMNLFVLSIIFAVINTALRSLIKVNGTVGILGFGFPARVTPWWVSFPLGLISLAFGILYLIGIINAANGKAKELPIVGKINFFK